MEDKISNIINFKALNYSDLIELIRAAQIELNDRGTLTDCRIVEYPKRKNSVFIEEKSHMASQ